MAKFQKERRATLAERKRIKHGDPLTAKLKQKPQPQSMSGKRKRKLFKKWRKEQKEAVAKGLITMEDVEMAVADGGTSENANKAAPKQFPMKRSSKVKVKQLKRKNKGKNKAKSTNEPAAAVGVSADAMVE